MDVKVSHFQECTSSGSESIARKKKYTKNQQDPRCKIVNNLHLWNVSFIDIVLISSPMGKLGLPFLTRMKGFSAKVWRKLGNDINY